MRRLYLTGHHRRSISRHRSHMLCDAGIDACSLCLLVCNPFPRSSFTVCMCLSGALRAVRVLKRVYESMEFPRHCADLNLSLCRGLTTSQAMLYVFVILWGLTGGGFAANWAGCANAIRQSGYHVDTGMVISLLCVSKGVGSVASGPISEKLIHVQPFHDAGFAYGTRYGVLIVFTGISATLGGIACLGRLAKLV